VIEIADRILPGMDGGTAAQLQKILTRQGMRFELGASVAGARAADDGVTLTVRRGDVASDATCDVLLMAIGRRPYTEGLGLDDVGVVCDERGRVMVDTEYATNVPGIFAIGDVIAGPMLAHKAEEEGIAAVERMAGLAGHVAYDCIPNVVYTWPEFASVGLSEEEAKGRGVAYRTGVFPFLANGRARAMNERDGQVKLLADATTDRILGAHILGPRASDLIAELAVAMEMEASAEDVARSVHAHPTLPEAIKEAALAAGGRAIHI
jgi:dihydrolipoamide dehydrogenase